MFTFEKNIFLDVDYAPTYVYDNLFWEIYFLSKNILRYSIPNFVFKVSKRVT